MGDAACSNKYHAISRVVVLDVVAQLRPRDVPNVLTGSQDGATERLVLVGCRVQVVEYDFLELLLDFFGFAQDDIALTLNR
jgi:hypothetical protein